MQEGELKTFCALTLATLPLGSTTCAVLALWWSCAHRMGRAGGVWAAGSFPTSNRTSRKIHLCAQHVGGSLRWEGVQLSHMLANSSFPRCWWENPPVMLTSPLLGQILGWFGGKSCVWGVCFLASNWGAGPTCHPQACATTGSPGSAGSAVERTLLRALQRAQGTAVIPSLHVLQRAIPTWGPSVWLFSSLMLVEVPMSVRQSVHVCWIRWGCVRGSSWAIPMCTLSVFGLCGVCATPSVLTQHLTG